MRRRFGYCMSCGHRVRLDWRGRAPAEHRPRRSGFGCTTFAGGKGAGPLFWTCRGVHTWHRVVLVPTFREAKLPA